MEETIGISEFKSKCIAILKDAQRRQVSLTITHRGQPLARIEPIPDRKKRVLGAFRDRMAITTDLLGQDWSDEWTWDLENLR